MRLVLFLFLLAAKSHGIGTCDRVVRALQESAVKSIHEIEYSRDNLGPASETQIADAFLHLLRLFGRQGAASSRLSGGGQLFIAKAEKKLRGRSNKALRTLNSSKFGHTVTVRSFEDQKSQVDLISLENFTETQTQTRFTMAERRMPDGSINYSLKRRAYERPVAQAPDRPIVADLREKFVVASDFSEEDLSRAAVREVSRLLYGADNELMPLPISDPSPSSVTRFSLPLRLDLGDRVVDAGFVSLDLNRNGSENNWSFETEIIPENFKENDFPEANLRSQEELEEHLIQEMTPLIQLIFSAADGVISAGRN